MRLHTVLKLSLLLGVLPAVLSMACEAKDPGSNDTAAEESGDGDGDGDEDGGEETGEETGGDEGDEDGGEEGEEDGCNFAECPCEGDECPPPMCDIWAQDCAEGEKCTAAALENPSSWDSNICVPIVDNPDAIGSPCMLNGVGLDGHDTCEFGAMCWNVDQDTGLGVCIGFCEGDGPNQGDFSCPSQSQFCSPNLNDGVLPICQEQCHPLDNPCDGGNDICVYTGEGFGCALDASGDMAPAGTTCSFVNSCNEGLYCTPADYIPECEGTGCCSPYCYTDEPSPCGDLFPGAECVPFFEEGQSPPGYETLGVCGIAQ